MGVSYSDIIERMRWAGKLKNDSAVAKVLGVTPQALSNYKKRGEIPTDLVLRFANIYGLSVDWLLTGEGQMYRTGLAYVDETKRAEPGVGEATAPYGKEAPRLPDLASLSPDEIIYVGKLLKILRGQNKTAIYAVKWSMDALLNVTEMAEKQEKVAPQGE